MTAFNRIGTTYAGAHSGMLEQILRNEWGYTGFTVTDMVNGADYMNWRDNIYNGGGAMLSVSDTFAQAEIGSMTETDNLTQVGKDTDFQQKMQQALKYYLYTFANSNAMNGVTADTQLVFQYTWWQIALVAADVVLGLITVAFAVIYIRNIVSVRKKEGENK